MVYFNQFLKNVTILLLEVSEKEQEDQYKQFTKMLIKIMNKLGEKEIQFLPDHKKFFSKYTEYKFKHTF